MGENIWQSSRTHVSGVGGGNWRRADIASYSSRIRRSTNLWQQWLMEKSRFIMRETETRYRRTRARVGKLRAVTPRMLMHLLKSEWNADRRSPTQCKS